MSAARLSKPDVILMRKGTPPSLALIPVDARAVDAIGKVPHGEVFGIRIMRGRSLPQHNLFWAVLDRVGRATKFETAERLLAEIKLHLGRYDLMQMSDGTLVAMMHSISFGEMPQGEFQTFMDDAMVFICAEVLPGSNAESLLAEAMP